MLPTQKFDLLLKQFPNEFASIASIVYANLERNAPHNVMLLSEYSDKYRQQLCSLFVNYARQYIKYRQEIVKPVLIPPAFSQDKNIGLTVCVSLVKKPECVIMLVQTNWGGHSSEYSFKLHEHLNKSFIELLRK